MPATQRHEWIDLLRGIAVVGMIWVHAANTFYIEAQQLWSWYGSLSFYHGLVAPTFFWLAGFMRGMAVAGGRPQRSPWPTVRRLLTILGVGYLLHLPQALTLLASPVRTPEDPWQVLCQADVLHCLALSCLALVAVERLPRCSVAAVVGLLVGAVLGVRWVNPASTGWVVVDAYLGRHHGSLFPLFPWLGFAAAGWLCGRSRLSVVWLGALGLALAMAMPWVPGKLSYVWFFAERLGWVLIAAALVSTVGARMLAHSMMHKSLSWLLLAGRESLVMYVAHLIFIYALPLPRQPLQVLLGQTLRMGQVAMVWASVLLLSLGVAWWVECWKTQRRASSAGR